MSKKICRCMNHIGDPGTFCPICERLIPGSPWRPMSEAPRDGKTTIIAVDRLAEKGWEGGCCFWLLTWNAEWSPGPAFVTDDGMKVQEGDFCAWAPIPEVPERFPWEEL